MPDQESAQGFIKITYYHGLLIAGGFTLLGGLIGAWLNHYFADRRNKTERHHTAYDEFSKEFTPALHLLDDPNQITYHIIADEFPKHEVAMLNFEHALRGTKNGIRFKKKWDEYKNKCNRIKNYCMSTAPNDDELPDLFESDKVTAKDFSKELKQLINELLAIAKH